MEIEDLAKVFVGDALVEAILLGDGIEDAVLENAERVRKAFDDGHINEQQVVAVQLRFLKPPTAQPPPPPPPPAAASAMKPVVHAATPMTVDTNARMAYNWGEGEDITQDCSGRSGLYPGTEEGRKQAMEDLKNFVLQSKQAKVAPRYKGRSGKAIKSDDPNSKTWKRDTIFMCQDTQHAANNPSKRLCAQGWCVQAERDPTSFWNVRGWKVIAR